MDSNSENEQKKKRGPRLGNLNQVRRFMSKKIREFELDEDKAEKITEYRCIGYLVGILLDTLETLKLEEIEARLERLEGK